jgi:hypothetical protein
MIPGRKNSDHAMARGLLAPLSPNEELALRRIASGQGRLASLASRDVEHLRKLDLIEEVGDRLQLTAIGWDRYARFDKTSPLRGSESADKINAALVTFFSNARR